MFAVVRTGGKQYRGAEGDKIAVEKLAGEAGDKITLGDELLAGADGERRHHEQHEHTRDEPLLQRPAAAHERQPGRGGARHQPTGLIMYPTPRTVWIMAGPRVSIFLRR